MLGSLLRRSPCTLTPSRAALVVTESRLIWKMIVSPSLPEAPVLSLRFKDVTDIMVSDFGEVLLTYAPADYPDELRKENPAGELDVHFRFSETEQQLRQFVLDCAYMGSQLRLAGEVLATGRGKMEELRVPSYSKCQ